VLVAARRTGLGQVRAYLAADLLRRLAERARLAPTVIDLLPDQENELRAVCAELNIHPPGHTLRPPVTKDQLAGQFTDGIRGPLFDVGVRAAGEPAELYFLAGTDQPDLLAGTDQPDLLAGTDQPDLLAGTDQPDLLVGTDQPAVEGLAGHWIDVAGAGDSAAEGTASPAGRLLALGEEPLSVRLNLMRHGYGEVLGNGGEPGGGETGTAAKDLTRWRELVARWAWSPSGAMSPRYADAITAAFADDLDTATALRQLAALADDPGEPDGVKFETFAAADRLFGLDLARDVGR
jgi:hypothetical protein